MTYTVLLQNDPAAACKQAIATMIKRLDGEDFVLSLPNVEFKVEGGQSFTYDGFFTMVTRHGFEMAKPLEKLVNRINKVVISYIGLPGGTTLLKSRGPVALALLTVDPSAATFKKHRVAVRPYITKILPAMLAQGWSDDLVKVFRTDIRWHSPEIIRLIWRELGLADAMAERFTPTQYGAWLDRDFEVRSFMISYEEDDKLSLRDIWENRVRDEGAEDANRSWLEDTILLRGFTDVLAPWTDWEREAFARLMLKEPPPWLGDLGAST
jgi:hypothetical protein